MRAGGGQVRMGFKASQWGVEWNTLRAIWELGDSLPEFDSGWLFDHFSAVRDRAATDEGVHEALTSAAALAALTRRLQFGHVVLGNTHRHPALLARMATTIDHIAGGNRFVLGLGTGWLEADHHMYGWPMPSMAVRIEMLESAVRVIQAMWAAPRGASLAAPPYELREAQTIPPPVTDRGPPIWLGVQGPRGLDLVARLADGWNANGSVDEFRERREGLLRACERHERDAAGIEVSAQVMCIGRPPAEIAAVADALIREGVDHLVFVILAADGPDGLHRLSREIVIPLRDRYA